MSAMGHKLTLKEIRGRRQKSGRPTTRETANQPTSCLATFPASVFYPCECGQVWVLIALPFPALVFPPWGLLASSDPWDALNRDKTCSIGGPLIASSAA